MKSALIFASVFGTIGIILEAVGAHGLKNHVTAQQLTSWETAARYQMYHALALLMVGLLMERGLQLKPTLYLFVIGTIFFSGSIYFLCLDLGPANLLSLLVPAGGISLIIGWLSLIDSAIKFKSP